MAQMLRYTVRTLLRTPGFTSAALICLALGLEATSAGTRGNRLKQPVLWAIDSMNVAGVNRPIRATVAEVSAQIPHLLGAKPLLALSLPSRMTRRERRQLSPEADHHGRRIAFACSGRGPSLLLIRSLEEITATVQELKLRMFIRLVS